MAGRGRSPLRVFGGRLGIALVIATVVMVGAVVGANVLIDQALDHIPKLDVDVATAPPDGANYLVVGSDSRQFVTTEAERQSFGDPSVEAGTRSDTIMVVHVEPKAQRTYIVSFPRDLWVNVPGLGMSKINAAFNSDLGGGADRLIATLKENFGIEINHYIEVDFKTFKGIVDAIGTVPLYLDRPAVDEYTGFVAVKAGCLHLDGNAALAWVRTRHVKFLDPATGRLEEDPRQDLSRIERQQEFIRQLLGLAMRESLANPFTANKIVEKVVDNLKVDAGFDKHNVFDLLDAFRTINPDDTSALEFATFPATNGYTQGQSVLLPDKEAARPVLERLSSFDSNAQPSAVSPGDVRVRVLNGSGRDGLARAVLDQLSSLGFQGVAIGDDPRGRVAVSEVRYGSGQDSAGRLVLSEMAGAPKLVNDPNMKDADVVVVLGADFAGLVTKPSTATTGAARTASTAVATTPAAGPAADCR